MSHKYDHLPLEALVFRVKSPCGRAYEVPMIKVRDDYVQFLMDADNLSRKEALQRFEFRDLESWFYEQFRWEEIERYGKLVKNPSPKQIKEALDHMRNGSPSNDCMLVAQPEVLAQKRAKKLDRALADQPVAPSRQKPRM